MKIKAGIAIRYNWKKRILSCKLELYIYCLKENKKHFSIHSSKVWVPFCFEVSHLLIRYDILKNRVALPLQQSILKICNKA